jgi:hypothetical protein
MGESGWGEVIGDQQEWAPSILSPYGGFAVHKACNLAGELEAP